MTQVAIGPVAGACARVREAAPWALGPRSAGPTLIDVREAAEWTVGRLAEAGDPRAQRLVRADAPPAVIAVADRALTDRRRPLVIYCRTGGGPVLAAGSLQRRGLRDVRPLAAGMQFGLQVGIAAAQPVTQH